MRIFLMTNLQFSKLPSIASGSVSIPYTRHYTNKFIHFPLTRSLCFLLSLSLTLFDLNF